MWVYYNKIGNLTTKIPHGEIIRQGATFNFYIAIDREYFKEDIIKDTGRNFLSFSLIEIKNWINENIVASFQIKDVTVETVVLADIKTFEKTKTSEITFDLIENNDYIVFHYIGNHSLIKNWGNYSATFKLRNKKAGITSILGAINFYVEKTFGISNTGGAGGGEGVTVEYLAEHYYDKEYIDSQLLTTVDLNSDQNIEGKKTFTNTVEFENVTYFEEDVYMNSGYVYTEDIVNNSKIKTTDLNVTDTAEINSLNAGSLISSLIPDVDKTYNLGSDREGFKNLYIHDIFMSNQDESNASIPSFTKVMSINSSGNQVILKNTLGNNFIKGAEGYTSLYSPNGTECLKIDEYGSFTIKPINEFKVTRPGGEYTALKIDTDIELKTDDIRIYKNYSIKSGDTTTTYTGTVLSTTPGNTTKLSNPMESCLVVLEEGGNGYLKFDSGETRLLSGGKITIMPKTPFTSLGETVYSSDHNRIIFGGNISTENILPLGENYYFYCQSANNNEYNPNSYNSGEIVFGVDNSGITHAKSLRVYGEPIDENDVITKKHLKPTLLGEIQPVGETSSIVTSIIEENGSGRYMFVFNVKSQLDYVGGLLEELEAVSICIEMYCRVENEYQGSSIYWDPLTENRYVIYTDDFWSSFCMRNLDNEFETFSTELTVKIYKL